MRIGVACSFASCLVLAASGCAEEERLFTPKEVRRAFASQGVDLWPLAVSLRPNQAAALASPALRVDVYEDEDTAEEVFNDDSAEHVSTKIKEQITGVVAPKLDEPLLRRANVVVFVSGPHEHAVRERIEEAVDRLGRG